MSDVGTCGCGGPGTSRLAASWLCEACYDDELARIMATRPGWGVTCGPPTDELMASIGWRMLRCWICDATWYGPDRQRCTWCTATIEEMLTAPPARPSIPVVAGFVWCPDHDHTWRGLTGEVCGVHGGPWACNRRGEPLPETAARCTAWT
jgi:hypothetical protein